MIYGARNDNSTALSVRDRIVTDRMADLGVEFLGPRYPAGIPRDSENVPTCRGVNSKLAFSHSLRVALTAAVLL